jgi:hypothetical protein
MAEDVKLFKGSLLIMVYEDAYEDVCVRVYVKACEVLLVPVLVVCLWLVFLLAEWKHRPCHTHGLLPCLFGTKHDLMRTPRMNR